MNSRLHEIAYAATVGDGCYRVFPVVATGKRLFSPAWTPDLPDPASPRYARHSSKPGTDSRRREPFPWHTGAVCHRSRGPEFWPDRKPPRRRKTRGRSAPRRSSFKVSAGSVDSLWIACSNGMTFSSRTYLPAAGQIPVSARVRIRDQKRPPRAQLTLASESKLTHGSLSCFAHVLLGH